MAQEKVTEMVMNINDLKCPCCYKKVKKLLCKFPRECTVLAVASNRFPKFVRESDWQSFPFLISVQIKEVRNQVFDEKQNTVSITVVCCSPEEIRHKLAKGGGKSVKSVVIKEPPKPKAEPAKPKETEKPKSDPKPDKPKEDSKPKSGAGDEKPKVVEKEKEKAKEAPPGAMMMAPQVPMGYPYSMAPPDYQYHHPGEASGYGGGYVRAVPAYDNYGYGPYGGEYYGNNINRGNAYYSNEENPNGCTIM